MGSASGCICQCFAAGAHCRADQSKLCLLKNKKTCAPSRQLLFVPLLLQVHVFGQDPMKAVQPGTQAKKRRRGCGAFNHYADGSGEWVRTVHSNIFHIALQPTLEA